MSVQGSESKDYDQSHRAEVAAASSCVHILDIAHRALRIFVERGGFFFTLPYMPFDDMIAHNRFYRAEVEIPTTTTKIAKTTAEDVAICEAGQ